METRKPPRMHVYDSDENCISKSGDWDLVSSGEMHNEDLHALRTTEIDGRTYAEYDVAFAGRPCGIFLYEKGALREYRLKTKCFEKVGCHPYAYNVDENALTTPRDISNLPNDILEAHPLLKAVYGKRYGKNVELRAELKRLKTRATEDAERITEIEEKL